MKGSRPVSTLAGKALAALALLSACAGAMAQYVWTDEKGVRQYSDRPPPASVPANRILRGPGVAPPSSAAIPAPAADAATRPAPSVADRNAEFNKRRAERAEKEKKDAEQEKLAEQKKQNCQRAANYKRSLESGMRMARVNANGEQVILDDAQRAQELQEASRVLESCAS